ncbi:hypothetical protein GGF46_004217 [Coemansia sp. RSA 552]|nr:hypothetical protein GGF46_004217 [Coemansia sp. RSA 552]
MDFLLRSAGDCQQLPSRVQVMRIYRGILREARSFFDDTTREFVQSYAKEQFRRNMDDRKAVRARRKLKNARTTLHLLQRANTHQFKSVLSVLENGYGQKGPRKPIMLEATVGIGRREEVFGNLNEVARYRPAFYALVAHRLGKGKLLVNQESLRSNHPLNVAKMQDRHWEQIRHKAAPPVDAATMEMLEERARTGIVVSSALQSCSSQDAELLRRWEARWVRFPRKQDVRRFYRKLLESLCRMEVTTKLVPNTGKYGEDGLARRNTDIAPGIEKPDLVPKKIYTFVDSTVTLKRPLEEASIIDIAGLDASLLGGTGP